MRYCYKDNKGNLFNFKSEHFVKYKEVSETVTLTDEEGNTFLNENGEPITQTITKTVRDGLEEGYTQITEEEFNENADYHTIYGRCKFHIFEDTPTGCGYYSRDCLVCGRHIGLI